FPLPAADIPTIRGDFVALLPTTPVVPTLALAVMEIECWFIAEHTHFPRYSAGLAHTVVCATLGYDPAVYDVQLVTNPAQDLNTVYNTVGRGYSKGRRQVQDTVRHLDYPRYYLDAAFRTRYADLNTLVDCIDRFLS